MYDCPAIFFFFLRLLLPLRSICKEMKDTKQQFEHVTALCRDLFSKKLHDYGPAWRILRPASVTDQIFIKANRKVIHKHETI